MEGAAKLSYFLLYNLIELSLSNLSFKLDKCQIGSHGLNAICKANFPNISKLYVS